MSILADLSEEEKYLLAILQDQSGIDPAEFSWTDDTSKDFVFRCWDFQVPWYRSDAKFQIDQCVAAGEMVLTRRGHVPIEEIRVGDEVWTHANRWRPVTYVWDKGVQKVVRVTNPGNTAGLVVTPDHKFWTRIGTRRMRNRERFLDAQEPALVAPQDFTPRQGERYATLLASPHAFTQEDVPGVERLPNCAYKTIPDETGKAALMWLAGLYVAEGYVRPNGTETVLSVHDDEAEIVVKAADMLQARMTKCPGKVTQVILPGRSLAHWLKTNFGHLAHGKRLPAWAFGMPAYWREALLEGLMFGDGHIRPSRRDESRTIGDYTTVSKGLAYDVRLLAQSLGRGANVSLKRPAQTMTIQGRTVETRDTYGVSLYVQDSRNNKIAHVDDYFWTAYASVEDAGEAHVYDIEVAGDHTFTVNGQVVSNCARAIGKSVGIQMRAWAFPFTNAGEEMLITAPEMIHLDPVTKNIENRIMSSRLSREFLRKTGGSNGFSHRPFEARFRNGARIVGRIPQKDGKGVKGMHPLKLEMDEAQDYPEPGWVELGETLKYGDDNATWRAHGVSRGVRDRYYKQTQPESGWYVHKWTAMHRPDWTPKERAAKAELYGSRDHPDYRRNILGQHGDAQSSLFVLARLMLCVDQDKDSAYNTSEYTHIRVNDEKLRDTGMPVTELIDLPESHKKYARTWIGMDVGMTNHPSEIVVFGEDTRVRRSDDVPDMRLRCIARVHLERISAPDQRAVMEKLWDFYRPRGFGMDRTGLGLPIYQEIVNGDNPGFAQALKGYNFSEKIVIGYDRREDDEYDEENPYGRPIMGNVLEYSSDMLRVLVDQRQILLPWDIDMLREFQGQTYVISKSSTDAYGKKQFNKGKFHALDACRMAVLCYKQEFIDQMKEIEYGEPVYDVFIV